MSQKSCFFFAADQNFFPYACLAARRVLDVSGPVDGFILHTGIVPAEDRSLGERVLGGRIGIIDVTKFMDATNFNRGPHPTLAAYIRLFADQLPEFEPYDRIAYSDADVLFNRSIEDLCNVPLNAPLLADRTRRANLFRREVQESSAGAAWGAEIQFGCAGVQHAARQA